MQKSKQSRKTPVFYTAPEMSVVDSVMESIICLSDKVSLEDLVEVEESW